MELNPDYVSVLPTLTPGQVLVAVMHYDKMTDAYQVAASVRTTKKGADHLATEWARDRRIERR
jgi:hypothetical protein